MGVGAFIRARDRLLATESAGASSREVCEEIVHQVRSLAAFEWCAVMTTDPSTLLPSGGVVVGFDRSACAPFWDNELLDPDFNKFADLARRHDAVATLHDAVDGDLERSPRYTKLFAGLGAVDELRISFVAGTSCLAIGSFLRPAELGPFTPEELVDVRALVPIATNALRSALGRPTVDAPEVVPVVVMLDRHGEVSGVSSGADDVLEDLRVNVDGELPGILQVAATKARRGRASALSTRLRGRSGRWYRLTASPMEGGDGTVAVTIDGARSDDIVDVLLDSYGLTQRETEIVLWLCRGMSTKEIAAELFISAHTVRDHIKAIYDKAGVNSRGELVAGLFSKHVLERFEGAVSHVHDL